MAKKVSVFPFQRYISDSRMVCTVSFRRQRESIPHTHNCFELVLVQGGSGIHCWQTTSREIAQGMFFLVVPGEMHWYENCRNLQLANILFLPQALDFLTNDDDADFLHCMRQSGEGTPLYPVLPLAALKEAESYLERIKVEQSLRLPGHIAMRRSIFQELLLFLYRACTLKGSVSSAGVAILGKMLRYLALNFRKEIGRKEIFRFAGCSMRTGDRIFMQYLHSTPHQELQKLRLQHAEHLLKTTRRPISEVAGECGFADSNYFAAVFHKIYGLSPSAFRKDMRDEV